MTVLYFFIGIFIGGMTGLFICSALALNKANKLREEFRERERLYNSRIPTMDEMATDALAKELDKKAIEYISKWEGK